MLNRETHHEESDVNVRALLIFFAVFVVFAVFTHFLIWFMYKGFVHLERRDKPAALTAVKVPADQAVPAQPRLQPFPSRRPEGGVVAPYRNTPVTDMQEMRRTQDEQLASYGWVDQQKGSVRIPVEVAKQLALQRGFNVVAAPQVTAPVATAPATTTATPAPATTPITTPAPVNAPAPVPPPAAAAAHSGAHQ